LTAKATKTRKAKPIPRKDPLRKKKKKLLDPNAWKRDAILLDVANQLRTLAEISADILALEQEAEDLLHEITKGATP
jgi:hypothetical protein